MIDAQIWFGEVELYSFNVKNLCCDVEGGEGFLALNEYLLNSPCQI